MRIRDVDVTVEGFDDMAADEIVRYIDYVQSKVQDPVTALDIRPATGKPYEAGGKISRYEAGTSHVDNPNRRLEAVRGRA